MRGRQPSNWPPGKNDSGTSSNTRPLGRRAEKEGRQENRKFDQLVGSLLETNSERSALNKTKVEAMTTQNYLQTMSVDVTSLNNPFQVEFYKIAQQKVLERWRQQRASEEVPDEVRQEVDLYDEFKGYYIIMDNAPFCTADSIERLIVSRGYDCIYLPPYSPELNPIEQFRSVVKSKLKKEKL